MVSLKYKTEIIAEVLKFALDNRVFDLIGWSEENGTTELTICNLGKIIRNQDQVAFQEKDHLGFWQKVPFLKAPMRIINDSGKPIFDSGDLENPHFVKGWVEEVIFEIVRHVIQHFFSLYKEKSTAYEFFLIKEIILSLKKCEQGKDQQLLNPDFNQVSKFVCDFHHAVKNILWDEQLANSVAKVRDNVTLFELTFSIPNRSAFMTQERDWAAMLTSLATQRKECLLLSKNGVYDNCEEWADGLGEPTEWKNPQDRAVIAYIKRIPLQSLRALINRNVKHSLEILRLANIPPTAPLGLFVYVAKVFEHKDISLSKYKLYAHCLNRIVDYVSNKLSNGYNTIFQVCYSSKLFEMLLTCFDEKGILDEGGVKSAFSLVSANIAAAIQDSFEEMAEAEELDIYTLKDGDKRNYFAVLNKPSDCEQFELYEKCIFLVGDINSSLLRCDDLEWWYAHIEDYRILISRNADGDIIEIYSITTPLTDQEIIATQKILKKIDEKRNKKTS